MLFVNSIKQSNTSSFDLSKYSHVVLEQSSINRIKYLKSLYEIKGADPTHRMH
jgi:hypothetical protein